MTKKSNPEAMKWPTDKPKYDKNYIRIFGRVCTKCQGKARGVPHKDGGWVTCTKCNGRGYTKDKK